MNGLKATFLANDCKKGGNYFHNSNNLRNLRHFCQMEAKGLFTPV